jgi:hypothetical protein
LPACLASHLTQPLAPHTLATMVSGPLNHVAQVSEYILRLTHVFSVVSKATARCSLPALQNFLSSATAIQTTDQRKLVAASQDATTVFVDSYIVLACAAGYMNNGGSLNITCLSSGSWTPFPNCVPNNGGPMTTTSTTSAPSNGMGCPIDATSTFTTTNGYFVNSSLAYTAGNMVTGMSWIWMNQCNKLVCSRMDSFRMLTGLLT